MAEHEHTIRSVKHIGIALAITLSFFIIELIGGTLVNSLALITDAWHMLNDSFSLIIALLTSWIARRPITVKKTYGYHRVEIIAAFVNGLLLWALVVLIFYEAFQRIQQPVVIDTANMLIIAAIGLLANGLSALSLSRSKDYSLNVKGAFLHVIADTLGSIGAISAGLIILLTGWHQADPLISIMIGGLIVYSSWGLIRDSLDVLLEGVPAHIDVGAVERRIIEQSDVKGIHDLHVWCISPSKVCMLSCHLIIDEETDRKRLLNTLIEMLKEEFGIEHITIQFEDEGYPKALREH